jgi:hypothetical protein
MVIKTESQQLGKFMHEFPHLSFPVFQAMSTLSSSTSSSTAPAAATNVHTSQRVFDVSSRPPLIAEGENENDASMTIAQITSQGNAVASPSSQNYFWLPSSEAPVNFDSSSSSSSSHSSIKSKMSLPQNIDSKQFEFTHLKPSASSSTSSSSSSSSSGIQLSQAILRSGRLQQTQLNSSRQRPGSSRGALESARVRSV